jgi:hypothetical protein
MLTDRLFDFVVEDGCNWVAWAVHRSSESWELHVGPACPDCQKMITGILREMWPAIPINEV